jgi:quercetin dioxygenase-like cupin family protein
VFVVKSQKLELSVRARDDTRLTCKGESEETVIMSEHEQGAVKAAEVKRLVDLLQYQDGSVVSRVLLKNKGGTVTLFAFAEGEGLSEHTAPFDALVTVVEGEAEVEVAGESFRVRQGETITLPANRPHAVRAATEFKMLLVMIRA